MKTQRPSVPQRLLILAVFAMVSLIGWAQTTIKGLVIDKDHEPVVGASVLVVGTTIGASTDLDGRFTLSVPSPNAKLSISYVGCQTVTVAANSPEVKSGIVLREDENLLDEVVVIGYGSVKKSDATGSVAAFKPDELNKGNRLSVQDAMVGKVAGVNVVPGSGAPGDGATIRIRSGASLSASNEPLFVVDGVPIDNSEITGSSNVIGGINPDDIESFTILKDASATAIYGSRASNGVIVITTKRGSDRVKVTYSGNVAVGQRVKTLDVLTADEYRAFIPTVTGVPDGAVFGDANTDWSNEIFRTAVGTDHNLSLTGKIGAINTPYRVSASYAYQEGILRNNDYNRFTGSIALSPSLLNDHLTFNLNAKISHEDNNKVDNSVVGNALRYDPTRPIHQGEANGPGLGYFIWTNGGAPMAIQTDNPVATLDLDRRENKVLRSIGNFMIDYKVHGLEDLRANVNLGYDVLSSKYNRDVPEFAGMMYTGNRKDGTGLDYNAKQNKRNFLLDAYLNYQHEWAGKHNFSAMAGYGWQHFWRKLEEETFDTKGNEIVTPYHFETENYLVSLYGRVNYSFLNRYLLTATLRADASSRFSKDNRWGYFPSVALAWRIIDEGFMQNQNVLNDLKLRATYGITGQQDIINDYPWMTTFDISKAESSWQFGDKWYYTYRPNGYDNDIKWEETTTWNFGVDYGFLEGRIFGSVDYYRRHTKDLLNTISVAAGTNYAPVLTTNIGSMDNEGVELGLNVVPVSTNEWRWTIGLNYTWQKSTITKLNVIDSDTKFVQTGAISGTGKFVQVFMVDKTPFTYYLCEQAYDDNGKPLEGQYVQQDGSIGTTEYRRPTDKSALPTSLLGFNTSVTFRNWDLGISGHGAFGHYLYNYIKADEYLQSVYSDQGSFSNILAFTKDHGFENQQLYSDYWLEKGDFFRIDNITLGYTFQRLWNKHSNLRLSFSVSNLYTFTKYDGIDPEIYSGIDREVYPRPRTFTFGATLNF